MISTNNEEMFSCEICSEKMCDNFRVVCPFCCVEICEKCFQYSITMELKSPNCIYCKKNLSIEFVLSNNETKWCKEVFIPFFENLCLEKEKSYLIDTMPKYKKMVQIREIKKDIKALKSDKTIEKNITKKFKDEFDINSRKQLEEFKKSENFVNFLKLEIAKKDTKKNLLNNELDRLQDSSNKNMKGEKKTSYICNCPNQKCRGFITENFNCEICKLEICKLCMVEKKKNHNCNRDDIESAQLIKDSSKPCPKCYVPIFKISGCNQMFCTNCHVVFDWKTLAIDKGNVHNAHYFDWMLNQNNNSDVNLEEIACGDILEIYRNVYFSLSKNFNHLDMDYYYSVQKIRKVLETNRVVHGEIIPDIRIKLNTEEKFEDYRIQYLDNSISEKTWKSRIAKDTINNEKYKSLIEVFEMYVTVTSDFIRQLGFEKITVNSFNKNYNKFYKYFQESIDDILQIFGGNLNRRQYEVLEQANVNRY